MLPSAHSCSTRQTNCGARVCRFAHTPLNFALGTVTPGLGPPRPCGTWISHVHEKLRIIDKLVWCPQSVTVKIEWATTWEGGPRIISPVLSVLFSYYVCALMPPLRASFRPA